MRACSGESSTPSLACDLIDGAQLDAPEEMSEVDLRNLYDEPTEDLGIEPPRRLVTVAKLKQIARCAVEDRVIALRTQVEEVAR